MLSSSAQRVALALPKLTTSCYFLLVSIAFLGCGQQVFGGRPYVGQAQQVVASSGANRSAGGLYSASSQPQAQRAPRPVPGVFPLPVAGQPPTPRPSQVQPEPHFNAEPPAGSLIARVHGNGLLGYVLFTPDSTGNRRTVIRVRLTGPSSRRELFNWKIHSFPQQISSLGCSSISIGPVLYDLSQAHGQLQVDKDIVISSATVDLFGDKPLLGRTLVLHGMDSGVFSCATIVPATRKKVYQVKFHAPVSGTVKLIQTSSATGLLAEYMMYSNGTRKSTAHKWSLVEGSSSDATLDARLTLETDKCNGLRGGSFIPTSTPTLPVTVSTEMPGVKGRSYQVVKNVKAFEGVPIVYLVLFEENDDSTIMACAPLTEILPKTARARFSSDSNSDVQGFITLTQDSPFDPTKVETNLKINKKAYSYGIDLLPTIRRRKNEPKSCPNVRETIYNPFFKDPEEIPPEGQGTTDQYAVGDLSGKFGTLSNKNHELYSSYDFNLPLYGSFSVVGRAVVVYAPDGPPIACSNIEVFGVNITTAYATFDVPLQGQFIFRQPAGECFGDTYVYIEISKPDGDGATKTFNHPWHVHDQPVNAGFDHLSATDCGAAAGHLNPFNVSTDCIYQRDCTMFTPLRCELGDLTGKLGPIDVPTYRATPSGEPDVGKYYFVDTDTQLCGPTSVVGRSIVIHREDFGAPRLTCANILEFKPKA